MHDTARNPGAESVLVVDDDGLSRDILAEMLTAQGVHTIHLADSGRKALRLLAGMAHAPDLLICDLFMPDMDGIEFMSELARRSYPGGVVLISGVNAEMLAVARELATNSGLKLLACFTKPVPRSVLAEALGMVTLSAA